MQKPHIAVIGGGISGLMAADTLQKRGIQVTLLEARDRLGGRMHSKPSGDNQGYYDLGPAWMWPSLQPVVASLIERLGLQTFGQYEEGLTVIEPSSEQPPQKLSYPRYYDDAVRLVGGMQQMIQRLAEQLTQCEIRLNQRVSHISLQTETDKLSVTTEQGETIQADGAIVTLPPRLAAASIDYQPALPDSLLYLMQNTPTWMASHAKAVVLYDTPFWRAQNLAQGFSQVGPLMEIHEHSPAEGDTGYPALFGFFAWPAAQRAQLLDEELNQAVISQLVRLFGQQAALPREIIYRDWSDDPCVSTEADKEMLRGHPHYGDSAFSQPLMNGRLTFAGAETITESGGLIEAGAASGIQAAERLLTML